MGKLKNSLMKRRDRIVNNLQRWLKTAQRSKRPRIHSVIFVGYAEGALGLGESFRNMLTALYDLGYHFSIYPFSRNIDTRMIAPFLAERYVRDRKFDINVLYLGVDQLPFCFEELEDRLDGTYNILRTYWELPRAPIEWAPLLEKIDELWVPNLFVANALRPIFNRKITIIPVCVNTARNTKLGRNHFTLDSNRFYFLFSFDYHSYTARKNPIGVAQAFSYAFPDFAEHVGLVIKGTGAPSLDPTTAMFLENLARLDPRVKLISGLVTRDEILSLIDVSDCYISLHRSEGFGLGMAEALALGKPVIGTDFSGSLDFLSCETGYPVPFVLRPLMAGEYPMGDGQSWAEPDLQAAIRLMRKAFEQPEDGLRRAAQGKRLVEASFSAERIARLVEKRLAEIRLEKGFL
jgi:glycosyltransferase involved in cell wall biosynthesis